MPSLAELTDNISGSTELDTSGGEIYPAARRNLWPLLPLAASFAYGAWLYPRLPASVPVHWNLAGEVDRYGGPLEAAFLFPLIFVPVALLLLVLPRWIPATPVYAGTRRAYGQLATLVLCFMLYIQIVMSQLFLGREIHLLGLITLGAGVLFILMGNLLPKLRRNPIAGARLPWAMQDDATWVKTQRVAGWSFIILGLVLVCLWQLPGYVPLAAMLAGKALAIAVVVWYSLRISRSLPAA